MRDDAVQRRCSHEVLHIDKNMKQGIRVTLGLLTVCGLVPLHVIRNPRLDRAQMMAMLDKLRYEIRHQ